MCRLDLADAQAIAKGLEDSGVLTSCDVRYNNISGDGASQLSAAVLGNPKIEQFNGIPVKEMRTDSLTSLDLSGKRIGVDGGMVVAGLLHVMSSLTEVRELIFFAFPAPGPPYMAHSSAM